MEFLQKLLEQQPLTALFLSVAIGYVIGEIRFKGFSLGGAGAVLFVALGVGWFAPRSAPPSIIGTFGLSLFLYAVGIHYGRIFFTGLATPAGWKANCIGTVGVLAAGATSLLVVQLADLKLGYALGLFAGSSTSTPALQAAIVALGNDDPAVGYSISYPFGVAGPILFLFFTYRLLKPRIDVPTAAGMELLEIAVRRAEYFGRPLSELMAAFPSGARIVAVRRGSHNQAASPASIVAENDVLLAVAPSRALLEEARGLFGAAAPGSITLDRSDLDYLRVFVSRWGIVGRTIGELALPGKQTAVVAHVRRGDAELLASSDVVLEFGDRVGLLANRGDFAVLRRYFGDSIRGITEFSYVSIGLGMAAGILLGAISFPIPGIGSISLGLSGVLIIGLVLGNLRHTGGLNWTIPLSASLVLRNLGLTVFLAQIGLASGPKFASAVSETGLQMLLMGVIVLVSLVVPIMVLGLWVFRMPFDDVAGIISGTCANPAILAYANRLTPTERPDASYATVFPGMTILKIVFVAVVPVFW
jgi:putative transport protein